MATDLTTQAGAAKQHGVQPYVISVLVRCYGIPTHVHPMNGKARCLDGDGMRQLADAVKDFKRDRAFQSEAACA